VRVDSGLWPVDRVSPFYDPMIAKVVAHGATRDEALDRLSTALADLELWGPRSNAAFLCALADHPDFRAGRFDTGFIDARLDELVSSYGVADEAALRRGLAALLREQGRTALQLAIARSPAGYLHSPWDALDAFQLSGPRQLTYRVEVDGEPRDVVASGAISEFDTDPKEADPAPVGGGFYINLHPGQCFIRFPDPAAALDLAEHGGDGVITAPMHGKLTALFVEAGQAVAKGDRLFIVEAMKMEHAVHAPIDGTIAEVLAAAGAQVGEGARLVIIEGAEDGAAAAAG
jgi:3-methylcrotonyl-CoA carboxylase alpha subunit